MVARASPLRAETDLVAPCTASVRAISMVQRIGISGAAPFPHSAGAHLRAPRVSGRNSRVDRGRPLFSTLLICYRRHGRDPEKDVLVPNKAKRGKNHASISGRACTALRPAAGGRPTRRAVRRTWEWLRAGGRGRRSNNREVPAAPSASWKCQSSGFGDREVRT